MQEVNDRYAFSLRSKKRITARRKKNAVHRRKNVCDAPRQEETNDCLLSRNLPVCRDNR